MTEKSKTVREGRHDGSASSFAPSLKSKVAIVGLAGLGVITFLVAMAAALPAEFIARSTGQQPLGAVAGTIWAGAAALPSGDRLTWRTDLLGSLFTLALKADVVVEGDETLLNGRLSTRGREVTLSDIRGRAGWKLVRSFVPDLEIECDLRIRVEIADAEIGSATRSVSGTASTDAGTCSRLSTGRAFSVPATWATAESRDGASHARIFLASDRETELVEALLSNEGDVTVTVFQPALALAPGMESSSGPLVYESRAR